MAETLNVSIPQDSINKIVEGHIKAAVFGALESRQGELLSKMVDGALNAKVEKNYKTYTFLDFALQETLQSEVRAAIGEWIEKNREKLHTAILKKLSTDKSLSSRLVDAMLKGVSGDWYFKFDVHAHKATD